jgi:tungstate transport system permease protein
VSSTLLGNPDALWGALQSGFHVIRGGQVYANGDQVDFRYTVEHTLRLAVYATSIASVIGLPVGCVLGLGRFRGRGPLLAIGNALTRSPPVVVGVLIVLSISAQDVFGGMPGAGGDGTTNPHLIFSGPLAGVIPPSISTPWFHVGISIAVFAQTLLALPIVIALSATALQRVPRALLEQAEVCGASWWARGRLALREARAAVLAGIIVAMGVTMTAIGALFVTGEDFGSCSAAASAAVGNGCVRYNSLALAALHYGTTSQTNGTYDTGPLGFAYAMLLMGLFLVTAIALTFLQQSRSSWIAGGQS